jgi:hypothetical protein
MLQDILTWVAMQWPPLEMIVGSIYRTADEEAAVGGVSLIHTVGPPYRAIDVHVSNLPGDHQIAADAIGALVNRRYVYDPTRLTKLVAFTQAHGTGPHIHLQVHVNTKLRTQGGLQV